MIEEQLHPILERVAVKTAIHAGEIISSKNPIIIRSLQFVARHSRNPFLFLLVSWCKGISYPAPKILGQSSQRETLPQFGNTI